MKNEDNQTRQDAQQISKKKNNSMESSTAQSKLAAAKTILSTAASVAGALILARSLAQDILPHEFHDYFFFNFRKLFSRFSSQVTMVIDEFDGWVLNLMYQSADTYLGTKISPSTHRFKVTKPENEDNFQVKMEGNQEVIDTFQGVKFRWVLIIRVNEARNFRDPHGFGSVSRSESRSFEVSFPKKYKDLVLKSYLPFIVKEAKSMVQEKRTIKIHSLNCDHRFAWTPVNLDHPATFDTLALDAGIKNMILEDLERFLRRREYYRKVGKAWKRGYLLYGPPGTGKSSLIAAMANKLKFDIYDLELTEIRANSELRRLLVATANRSILVVEDIDCTIEFQDRLAQASRPRPSQPPGLAPQPQVTLSGFLNFIDGLWSSCGDERIIIFTTNHKDKLDPALLRPGRMDVHVHMSYCTPYGFRILAYNYLGMEDHALFGRIEELIVTTEVTPAEVAEQLMRSDDLEKVLNELIEFIEAKKKEQEEGKARKSNGEPEISPVADTEDGESAEQADFLEE